MRGAESVVRTSVGVAAALNLFVLPVELFITHGIASIPVWPIYLSMAFGATLLGTILLDRLGKLTRFLPWLFVVNALFVQFALYMIYANVGPPPEGWVFFQASKMGTIIAALLAPNFWSGLAGIAVHGGLTAYQFFMFPPELQNSLRPEEPWAIWGFCLGGLFLLGHRIRVRRLHEKALKAYAETETTRRLAESFLQIRDLMNTPVQSIEIAATLLSKNAGDPKEVTALLREACDRLRRINLTLKQHEGQMPWKSGRGGLED